MSQSLPRLADDTPARVDALRLKVQTVLLIGASPGLVREYVHELALLLQPAARESTTTAI